MRKNKEHEITNSSRTDWIGVTFQCRIINKGVNVAPKWFRDWTEAFKKENDARWAKQEEFNKYVGGFIRKQEGFNDQRTEFNKHVSDFIKQQVEFNKQQTKLNNQVNDFMEQQVAFSRTESKQNFYNKNIYNTLLKPFKWQTNALNPHPNTIRQFFVENVDSGIFTAQDLIDVAKTINPDLAMMTKKSTTIDQFFEIAWDPKFQRFSYLFTVPGVHRAKVIERGVMPYIASLKRGDLNYKEAVHKFGENFFGISGEDPKDRVRKTFNRGIRSQLYNKIRTEFTTQKGMTRPDASTPESIALDEAGANVLNQMGIERRKSPNNPENWQIKNFSDALKSYGEHYEVAFKKYAGEAPTYKTTYNELGEMTYIGPKRSETAKKVNKALLTSFNNKNIVINDDFLQKFFI